MTADRRTVLSAATLATATAAVDARNVIARPTVQWRMSTTWTKALEQLQRSAQLFAKVVEEMSGGRFRIEVVQAARKVHASFTRFQALVDPWDRAAEGGSLHLVGV